MSNIAKKMPTSYGEADRMIGDDKRERVIANNTKLVRLACEPGPDAIGLVHHSTRIATFYLNGMLLLDCHGYRSATTKDRLSGVLRHSAYSIFQRQFAWFIGHRLVIDGNETNATYDYYDGMTIDLLS